MRKLIATACGLALLAACSAEKPVTNEQAVPQLLAATVDLTPVQMLKRQSSQILDEFMVIARGFAGDKADAWDKARLDKEIDAAYAPLAAQIETSFVAQLGAQMDDGEGARLLAMLDDPDNAKVMKCAFSLETGEKPDPWQYCAEQTGATASEEAKAGFNKLAGLFADAVFENETMAAAMGYATCGVIAKFGEDISRGALEISFDTTTIGTGANKRPCPDYDSLAREKLAADLPPHFAKQAPAGQAAPAQ